MTRVKLFRNFSQSGLELSINQFISGKKLVDIKYFESKDNNDYLYFTALIITEED